MSEPKIFTKNYIDSESVITVSSGDGSKANLYDRDIDSLFQTSGQDDDADTFQVSADFYEGGVLTPRTIDTLMILNHNLNNWAAMYFDGSTYQPMTLEANDVSNNTIKSFTPVSTTGIVIICVGTQIADAEKFIGELIACALQVDIGHDLETYDQQFREKTKDVILGDGSLHKMVTRWAQNRTEKYEASVRIQLLATSGHDPEEERLALRAIKEAGEPFLWQPESAARPAEIFLVHWANGWNERYVSSYKGAGVEISMQLKEV